MSGTGERSPKLLDQETGQELSVSSWWRKLCEVTPRVYVSGDLHPSENQAKKQLNEWLTEGITHIFDCREEWDDSKIVQRHAPDIKYFHIGTHDNGGEQNYTWFDNGTALMEEALLDPESKILIHCHMGVNRAPSMAFALLLRLGHGVKEGLQAIRSARPIAAILYAESALVWHAIKQGWSDKCVKRGLTEILDWHSHNRIDLRWVISKIRLKERDSA